MADIVARLRLDNKDYEDKLAKAKKSTKNFSQEGGAGLGDMMGKFKALGAAVAASKAVMETFNAVIASSQTIGDAYTQAMEGAKGAVNEFVYSVANADFSGFNGGLKDIIRNAKEAAAAMDSLGNAQISYDYLTAGYKSSFKTNMATAKDKSLSVGERQSAFEAAQGDLDNIKEAVDVYTAKVINAVVESAESKGNNINKDFITRENIDRVMKLDLSANGEAEKKALQERYDEFKKLKKQEEKLEKAAHVARMNGYASAEQYEQQLADLRAKINSDDMQMAALYNAMLVKGTDEWLKGLTDLVVKADNANAAYQELKTSSLEVANALGVAAQNAAKLSAEASAANAKDAAIRGNIAANNPANATMAGLPQGSTASALPATIAMPEAVTEDITKRTEEYNNALRVLEETSVSASEGLGAIGNMMGAIGGQMGEGAGAWMSYAGSIISAVGSALPSLEALAAAQAAAAATKTALSPWTVIASVAAVGSIVAAMANLPKFATGGIVPGTSFSGDNVLIRANSGERVLTREQNARYERGMGMGGKVVFEIKGDRLVGILNNQNKMTSVNYG